MHAKFLVAWCVAGALALISSHAAATPLAPATSFIQCKTDFPGSSQVATDPSSCSLGGGGALSSFGAVVQSPFISLVGQVSSIGFPVNAVGAAVTGVLDYEFQLTGGTPGTVVPVQVDFNLDTVGDDPDHAYGFTTLSVGNVEGLGVTVAACTAGQNCGGPESLHSSFIVHLRSGGPNATVHIGIQAFAGASPFDQFASVSADPYLFVDPSFTGAGQYTISVSAGVANVPLAVPEPPVAVLLAAGLGLLALRRRR